MLETPAVSYMPVTSETYDYHLPNGLSHCARVAEEVRAMLGEILAGRRGMVDPSRARAPVRPAPRRHSRPARPAIACWMCCWQAATASARQPRPAALTWLKAWVAGYYRTFGKRINGCCPNHRNGAAYHAHRFPGVTVSELNDRIARFGAQLRRFGGVRAEARSPYVFAIHDPEAATRSTAARNLATLRSRLTSNLQEPDSESATPIHVWWPKSAATTKATWPSRAI